MFVLFLFFFQHVHGCTLWPNSCTLVSSVQEMLWFVLMLLCKAKLCSHVLFVPCMLFTSTVISIPGNTLNLLKEGLHISIIILVRWKWGGWHLCYQQWMTYESTFRIHRKWLTNKLKGGKKGVTCSVSGSVTGSCQSLACIVHHPFRLGHE